MQQKVFIANKNNLRLATVLHRPVAKGKFPAVILLHGFAGYKEERHIKDLAEKLEKSGFVAAGFDASGFGESEGSLEKDFRVTNYLLDIDSVYKFLVLQSFVDAGRIGVWGHSLGAMLAIVWASKHPEIKAIVAVSPPTLMGAQDRLAKILPAWRKTGWLEVVSSKYGKIKIPYAFAQDARKFNALDYVDKLKGQPLFVITGTKDTDVPPKDSQRIFKQAREPKRLLEFEEMDHHYKKKKEQLAKVNQAVVDFFTNYL